MIQIRCDKCNNEFSIDKEKCPKCNDPVNITAKFYCGDCNKEINIKESKCHNCNKIPKEVIIKSKNGKTVRTSFTTSDDIYYIKSNSVSSNKNKKDNSKTLIITLMIIIFLFLLLFPSTKSINNKNDLDENIKEETFISIAHDYIDYVKYIVEKDPYHLVCQSKGNDSYHKFTKLINGKYYIRFNSATTEDNKKIFNHFPTSPWNDSDIIGYVIIDKEKKHKKVNYSYYIYMVDQETNGLVDEIKENELYNHNNLITTNQIIKYRPDKSDIYECIYDEVEE